MDQPSLALPVGAVPAIDIAPFLESAPDAERRVPQAVRLACEQIGFLTITGHGVPAEQIERTGAVARAFFDLPEEEKNRLKLTPAGAGYSPLQGESLAATLGKLAPADLKESLNVGADFEAVPWPARPAELKTICIAYFEAMNRLAGHMLRIFATALELPADYFAAKIDHSSSFLRIINYPAPAREPEPGQLRAGAHTDYGALTILRSDDTRVAGGLQVRNRAGDWLAVQTPPGAFVVNLGDMMMRWTNDRWVSTLHRVVNPPAELRPATRRQSLVFFHNPNPDTLVTCLPGCCGPDNPPRYADITAGEFIAEKSRQAYGPRS
jgi:isopenicillin N synthase-like dioxygenase